MYQCEAMKRHCTSGEAVERQEETYALGSQQPYNLESNDAYAPYVQAYTHSLESDISNSNCNYNWASPHIKCDIRLTILDYFLPVNFHNRKYVKRYAFLLTFLAIQPF